MQTFVAEHGGHSCNCVVTINCLPMSAVDVFYRSCARLCHNISSHISVAQK
jgi:hypothetical protein